MRGSQEEKGKSIEQRSHGKEQWKRSVDRNGDPAGPKPRTQHKKEQIGRGGGGMSKKVSQMSKHIRSSLGMCLGKAQSVDHKKVTVSLYKNKLLFFWPRGEYSYFSADFRLKIFL